MGVYRETTTRWMCDRCGVQHVGDKPPHSPENCWGKFKVEQDAGWDWHGAAWAPRMREPVLLCGPCIEVVWRAMFPKPEEGPDAPDRD